MNIFAGFKKDEINNYNSIVGGSLQYNYFDIDALNENGRKIIQNGKDGEDNIIGSLYLMIKQNFMFDMDTEYFYFIQGFRDILSIDNKGNFGMGGEYVEEKDLDLVISGGEIDIEKFISIISFVKKGSLKNKECNVEEWLNELLREIVEKDIEYFKKIIAFWTGVESINEGIRYKVDIYDGENNKLPESHSCAFTLDLRNYKSKKELKEKLMNAVDMSQGTQFS